MTIFIRNLRVETIIGINPSEREKVQPLVLNIEIDYFARNAAASDSIEDALDYKTLQDAIAKAVKESSFGLLETLVEHLLDLIFETTPAKRAVITIDKPKALDLAESVAVRGTRSR